MKKYLVAAALIVAFATPALAADYYVALRIGGGGCEVMSTEPTDTKKLSGLRTSFPGPFLLIHELLRER
jgi:opacity protein-like surface antigen